jgi:hypothetical protein
MSAKRKFRDAMIVVRVSLGSIRPTAFRHRPDAWMSELAPQTRAQTPRRARSTHRQERGSRAATGGAVQ